MSFASRLDHTYPLVKHLNILPVRKYFYHVCQLVYEELHDMLLVKLGFGYIWFRYTHTCHKKTK